MIVKVFGIYDSKGLAYRVPFFFPATGAAVRFFSDLMNDPQVEFSRHPGDYVLYQLGSFDDSSGQFENTVPPLHMGVGSDFVMTVPARPLKGDRSEELANNGVWPLDAKEVTVPVSPKKVKS